MKLRYRKKPELSDRERVFERMSGKAIIYSFPLGLIAFIAGGWSATLYLLMVMGGLSFLFATLSLIHEDDFYIG